MELTLRLLALILVSFLVQRSVCSTATGNKTSEFLKRKFANYDKQIRPYFGDKPVVVTVSGYVLDISDIDEINQDFGVTIYLRHEWKDPRLEFTESEAGAEKLGLTEEYFNKLWRPDSFVVNERESRGHDLVTENHFARLSSDGTVLISNRFTIKMSCSLDLGWFPFDRHTCPMLIESYGHSSADFIYKWNVDDQGNNKTAVQVAPDLSNIKFAVAAINNIQETVQLKISTSQIEKNILTEGYSRLAVEFFFVRHSARFVHEIYFPAIILTFMAFITLLHATGTPKARLQISIIVEAVMIIVMAVSARTIPPVSYQTALDFYLCICLITITVVVIVNVIICLIVANSNESNGVVRLRSVSEENPNNLEDEGKEVLFDAGPRFSSKTSGILTLSVKLRFVVPILFVIFNVLYWMVVLIGSSFFPDDFLILESFTNN